MNCSFSYAKFGCVGLNRRDLFGSNIVTFSDYYPFGMVMPERNGGENYRYSFNGKEGDDEVKGNGNHLDFGARCYDSRLGRFLSLDAYESKYPSISPYVFAGNMPIVANDPSGDTIVFVFFVRKSGERVIKLINSNEIHSIFFKRVIRFLNSRPENVFITEMLLLAKYKDIGGYYQHSGVTDGVHKVALRTTAFGFDKDSGLSTIFEELFHASQRSLGNLEFYNNSLILEAEAKVATLYFQYTRFKKSSMGSNMYSYWKSSNLTESYETALLFKEGKLNTNVSNYFDALESGNKISRETETKFRKDVAKWTNTTLLKVYQSNRHILDKGYKGQTPLFDALVKYKGSKKVKTKNNPKF